MIQPIKCIVLVALASITLCGCVTPPKHPEAPSMPYQAVNWSQLDGWTDDSTHEAWSAFLNSCKARGKRPEWLTVCASAQQQTIADAASARHFFETQFTPYRLLKDKDTQRPRDTGLITGYYEPLLYGARKPAPMFTVPLSEGPKGALAVPLTPGRSLAVDTSFIPLGAPVFLSTTYPAAGTPLRRLMMAQDTGGAIKGSVRADFFWGFGKSAGEAAGRMRQDGQMWVLWPKGQALPEQISAKF